ncbi:MAG TPA: hypothetical protein VF044_02660 [Actinomycetota bacterium]
MTRLLASELLRARSRRIVWVLVVASLAGVVVGVVLGVANSERPTPQQEARADRAFRRDMDACLRSGFPGGLPEGYASLEDFCEDSIRPEHYAVLDTIRLADMPAVLEGASLVVVLLGVVLGSSLGGADWSTGTMTTTLTWEPRRLRVVGVRALVVAVVVAVATLAIQAWFAAAWVAGTSILGATATAGGFVGDVAGTAVRVAGIAAAFGVVAFAVATVGRSTVAGIGILFGYLVVVEGFVSNLWDALPPRLLVRAATVVISETPMLAQGATATYGPDGAIVEVSDGGVLLGVAGAWVVVGAYVAALLAIALAVVRARDVQ